MVNSTQQTKQVDEEIYGHLHNKQRNGRETLERLKKNNFICGLEKYIINSTLKRSFINFLVTFDL
jgi:hypothetical protein